MDIAEVDPAGQTKTRHRRKHVADRWKNSGSVLDSKNTRRLRSGTHPRDRPPPRDQASYRIPQLSMLRETRRAANNLAVKGLLTDEELESDFHSQMGAGTG